MFGLLSRRRRARLRAEPFPEAWRETLRQNLGAWPFLEPAERRELEGIVQVMLAEKRWKGCGGLELDDVIRVTIAGQAAMLLLGIEHDYYRNVRDILVYPRAYRGGRGERGEGGVVSEEPSTRLGEAWLRGPVVLSWGAAEQGGRTAHDGRNVVYHEFAHKLDMLDGAADGVPPLEAPAAYRRWYDAMMSEYQALQQALERGRKGLLRPYGASAPEEFFAVAVEVFFEQGRRLQREAPELYGVLRDYFQQDPAARTRQPEKPQPDP
jgi:Mlc titration factor MtfA (ptsG expression regulator)